ncbi:MAG: hypothetical protein ACEPOV_10930 [Hyphomicrobiales bacterium]
MKLDKDIKARIDNYFSKISAEELLKISTEKYGFELVDDLKIKDKYVSNIETKKYSKQEFQAFESNCDIFDYSSAA